MKKAELTKAILKVMAEVKGVEKNLTVGTGNNSYRGVSDKDVKQIIGKSMQENGLTILQIDIEPVLRIDRWETVEFWNQKEVKKQKQSVFTEVKVTYLLMHESGESIEIVGYGHGIDSQDKSAGKATTYALKYALLYTFLVPTGAIDDADNSHSDDTQVVPVKAKVEKKVSLNKERFDNALKQIEDEKYSFKELKNAFTLTKAQRDIVKDLEEEAELEKVLEESKEIK
jgi:hypothetical protein